MRRIALSINDVPVGTYNVRDRRWNGWEVPIVTAQEFRDILAKLAADDSYVASWKVESDDLHLRIIRPDESDESDYWGRYGVNDAGEAVYLFDGWVFEEERPNWYEDED